MDNRLDRWERHGPTTPMKPTAHTPQALQSALAEVRAVYSELEQRPAERDCIRRTECCQFKLTGRTPFLTKGETLVALRALRASGRTRVPQAEEGACPLLERTTGRCMIYADRPFGCRTHFCAAAGGPRARRDVIDLIHRLEAVDATLGGDGASALPAALARELRAGS